MKTFIIAEAGVNHNGSVDLAKKLIDAGSDTGVDAVKFQTFIPEALSAKYAPMAEYQKSNTGSDESQVDMLKKLTLSFDSHIELINYCKIKGVQFCTSAFDNKSVEFVKSLDLPFWKIPSGEITNYPFLKQVALDGKPVIMSTGMCSLSDVEKAIAILLENGLSREKLTLLHCNTEYPTPFKDVNLNVIRTMKNAFQVKTGFSDHTVGIEVPIAAVALGAEVIEKHITLDKELSGPDHAASITPDELKAMVAAIRNIEESLGSGIKRITDSEKKNIAVARKSIVAARKISAGEIISDDMITAKRPGTGLSPFLWKKVVGSMAIKDFNEDDFIEIQC